MLLLLIEIAEMAGFSLYDRILPVNTQKDTKNVSDGVLVYQLPLRETMLSQICIECCRDSVLINVADIGDLDSSAGGRKSAETTQGFVRGTCHFSLDIHAVDSFA